MSNALNIFAAALLSIFCDQALGQKIIVPGDPSLRIDRVHLGTDTLVVLITPKDSVERTFATLVREVNRTTFDGQTVFRETQRYAYQDGTTEIDTLDVASATLALVRSIEVNIDGRNAIRVRGERLVGTVAYPDSGERPVDRMMAPFFHDMMNEAFIGTYPIEPGFELSVPVTRFPQLVVRRTTFRIIGVDTLRTAKGPIPSLVVSSAGRVTSWLSLGDHHLLRLHWSLPDGTAVWKLPIADREFR